MFHHTKYTKSFLITKLTTGHWSKPKSTLDTSLRVHLFFDSELYLCRSKESNNQGIKVQVKGTFKSYSFLSQKKQESRQALLEFFLNPKYKCAANASTPHFKINMILFCCPLFFKLQVNINKMANKLCHLLP